MRFASICLSIVAITSILLATTAGHYNVVTVTKYIDIHDNDNDKQYFNFLSDGITLVSNVSNITKVLRNICEYVTPFGIFTRIKNFLIATNNTPHNISDSLPNGINISNKFLDKRMKIELLTAIKTLQSYGENSQKSNTRRRDLFKQIPRRQQKLCEEIGYMKKLFTIDSLIEANQDFLSCIASVPIEKYEFGDKDFDILEKDDVNKNSPSKTNFRVIEALGHYVRDWSRESDQELNVILKYVKGQLDNIIPPDERTRTVIVIPGSGLGRIAHEIAEMGKHNGTTFGSVHAVEYSGIMHLCNDFVYSDSCIREKHTFFPFIHTCSNHINKSSQFRAYDLHPRVKKPRNLFLHHEDFRHFELPNLFTYQNVVVISVFFLDTAPNMIEYFERIQHLTTSNIHRTVSNGYWINVGPLKYGSAPRVEFNLEEIKQIRLKLGWKDIDSEETANNRFDDKFVGYMTDRQSLWQAFYSLCMWSSARIENSR